MKKSFLILLFLLTYFIGTNRLFSQCERIPFPFPIEMPICNNNPYLLIFEDNFDGNSLDMNKWELQVSHQGALQGAANQEVHTLNNIDVSNGTLKIIAKRESIFARAINWKPDNEILEDGLPNLRQYDFTSSNIWTKYNDFREGKYEIRFKLTKTKGIWPAFWTFSGDSEPGGSIWSELDIFEIFFQNSFRYTNNIHFDLNNDGETGNEQCRFGTNNFNFDEWSTITCFFENDKLEFFINGNFINRKTRYITPSGISLNCDDGTIAIGSALDIKGWPRASMQLILAMGIQSGNEGPSANTPFPAVFEIDYVRYWRKDPIANSCNQVVVKGSPFTGTHIGDWGLLTQNASVEPGTAAEVIVREQLYIQPNFHAKAGSYFHAKADPIACGTSARNGEGNLTDTIMSTKSQNAISTEQLANSNTQPTLYPNPTTGSLTIAQLEQFAGGKLEIVNLMGQTVFSQPINASTLNISLAHQPKGIYLVKISSNKENVVQKVVLE